MVPSDDRAWREPRRGVVVDLRSGLVLDPWVPFPRSPVEPHSFSQALAEHEAAETLNDCWRGLAHAIWMSAALVALVVVALVATGVLG